MNQHEFMVVAMRRSGHHAIVNWIMDNFSGSKCFINDAKLNTNPYKTGSTRTSIWNHFHQQQEAAGDHQPKDLLMYNYEDQDLSQVPGKQFTKNHDQWVGKSKTYNSLIVLRDPYNLIASKLRWYRGEKWKPSKQELDQTPVLWKMYAKEFLSQTSYLKNKICINYNNWFSSRDYKKQLAQKLFLSSFDKGVEKVAQWGPNTWGDSFDNTKFEGQASQMKVLSRWQAFKDDSEYIKLISDKELQSLSHQIFGKIID